MPNTPVKSIAEHIPGQYMAMQEESEIDEQQAVSANASFESVKELLHSTPSPRRPNRNKPRNDVLTDADAARAALRDKSGDMPYEDFRRELGLEG